MANRILGVTLVELIVTIVIVGIIATVVAVFIRSPVEGYVDTARRAELTDVADTALRRITRDLRTALPNSIRITPVPAGSVTIYYLEFLQTSGGGRYREMKDSAGNGNILDFDSAITQFDVIGPLPSLSSGDSIVVYNLFANSAISNNANAYVGDNRTAYSSSTGSTITISSKQFPYASPGRRFQVVRSPVTYECNPSTGRLIRYWNYAIDPAQPTPPTAPPLATVDSALLALNVVGCAITYETNAVAQRNGVVALTLELEQQGERIRLLQQVHVSNVP